MKIEVFKKILFFIVCPLILLYFTLGSFAWMRQSDNQTLDTRISQGLVIQQYFHSGTGTEQNPFVITRPIHYYHLVELYERDSTFENADYYFQVGYNLDGNNSNGLEVYNYDDYGNLVYQTNEDGSLVLDSNNKPIPTTSKTLNMGYYSGNLSLIPIGTSEHPFNGSFDGADLTIKNLTITASEVINGETKGTCDVGVFGHVGPEGKVSNVYFDNVNINLTGLSSTYSCVNGLIDSTLTVETSKAHVDNNGNNNNKCYVGYLIGHLYQYTTASIDYNTAIINIDSTPITNVYFNNVTILGGASSSTQSNFGYIGYVDVLDGQKAITISRIYDKVVEDSTGDEGWGGTMNMTNLYDRIQEIVPESNGSRTYVQAETIVEGATVKDTPLVIANTVGGTVASARSDLYYWSAAKDAYSTGSSADTTGGVVIASNAGDWTYLYGMTSSNTNTTYVYTKTGENKNAIYIQDVGNYLSFDFASLQDQLLPYGSTVSKNGAKWIPTTEDGLSSTYYAQYYNIKYYLCIRIGSNGPELVAEMENANKTYTTWTKADNGEFYTTYNSKNYYLNYNGTWELVPTSTKYALTDKTNYLAAAASGTVSSLTYTIYNATTAADGYMWDVQNPNGNTTFSFVSNGTTYYLAYNNGLVVSTTSFTWTVKTETIEGKNYYTYYYNSNGINYFIVYDSGWKAVATSGYKIHSDDNYIGINNDSIINTSESNGTLFQLTQDANGLLFTAIINGTTKYLSTNGAKVILSTTKSTSYWQEDADHKLYRSLAVANTPNGTQNYYLIYNNEWTLGLEEGTKFYLDSHYLSIVRKTVDNVEYISLGDTNEDAATLWQVQYVTTTNSVQKYYIYTVKDSQAYYLTVDSLGLAIANSQTQWSKDGNDYYITYEGVNYYVTYNNGWTVTPKNATYIYHNVLNSSNQVTATYYLSYRNTAITSSGELDAVLWQVSQIDSTNTYYIFNLTGTVKNYLGLTTDLVLAKTTNATVWTKETNGTNINYYSTVDGVNYYLYYNELSNNWELAVKDEQKKLKYTYYVNGSEETVYLTAVGGTLTYTTSADNAVTWHEKGDGQLLTYIGATPYYLTYEVRTIKEYSYISGVKTCTKASLKTYPTLSTTLNKSWTHSDGYYMSIAGVKHNLYFNESSMEWEFQVSEGIRFCDANGLYVPINITAVDLTAENIQFKVSFGKPSKSVEGYLIHSVEDNSKSYAGNCNLFILVGDTKYYLKQGNNPDSNMKLTLSTTPPNGDDYYRFFIKNGLCYVHTYDMDFRLVYATDLKRWEFVPDEYYNIKTVINDKEYYFTRTKNKTTLITGTGTYTYAYSMWYKTSKSGGGFYLSYGLGGQYACLYCDNSGNLSVTKRTSKSNGNVWYEEDEKLYTLIGTTKYYLGYDVDNNKWFALPNDYSAIYASYDGDKYLKLSGSTVSYETSLTDSAKWFKTVSGSGYVLYQMINNVATYLTYSVTAGFGANTNSASATVVYGITSSTNVTEATNVYFLIDGVKYYLTYDSSGWNVQSENSRYINIDGGYVKVSGTSLVKDTSSSNASLFAFSNLGTSNGTTTTIGYFTNGVIKYFNYSTNVTLSTSATTFTVNGGNYCYVNSSKYYYLSFNSSTLTCQLITQYYLYDNTAGKYLSTSGSKQTETGNYGSVICYYYNLGYSTTKTTVFTSTDYTPTATTITILYYPPGDSTKYSLSTSIPGGTNKICYSTGMSNTWTIDSSGRIKNSYSKYLKYANNKFDKDSSATATGVCQFSFIPAVTTTLTAAGSTPSVTYQSVAHTGNYGAINQYTITTFNKINNPTSFTQTLAGSVGVPSANDNKFLLDTSITTYNNFSKISTNNSLKNDLYTTRIVYASNIYDSSSTNTIIDSTGLYTNIKFNGRSLSDITGAQIISYRSSKLKYLDIVIPKSFMDISPNNYGYTHHTLKLVTPTAYETCVLNTFTIYLVNGSWTTTMPRDYGLVYKNGVWSEITLSGLNVDVTQSVYTYTICDNELTEATGFSVKLLSTVEPTNIYTKETSTNPTVSYVGTTDQLYVMTTYNNNYKRGTYLALQLDTTDDNQDSTNYYDDYHASYKNTGYIVGGAYSSASGSGIGDIRVSGYSKSNISSSFRNSNFSTIYTFNDSGTTPVAINDNANAYQNYAATKESLKNIINNSDALYGLHFMDASISTSHLMTAESVYIQNKYYTNYQLPESSIDFNVYTQGAITLYAGDYYTSGNSSFFSLHRVYRNSDNTISAIKEISEIYTKDGLTTKDYYIYKFTDGTYTDANGGYTGATTLASGYNSTPVFKTKWLTSPTNGKNFSYDYVYYFEIPCNKGEYCLGSVSGSNGGYLLYLDLSANGKSQSYTYNQESYIGSDPLFTQCEYLSNGTTLNMKFNFSFTVPDGNNNSNFSIKVSYDENYKVFDARTNCDVTFYTLEIYNKTGHAMDLTVLLIDDDDDVDNVYKYRYKIIYNGSEYTLGVAYDSDIKGYYASSVYNLPIE